MNRIINYESVLAVIGTALSVNDGDLATQEMLLNIGCDLLDVSQDRIIEMLDEL